MLIIILYENTTSTNFTHTSSSFRDQTKGIGRTNDDCEGDFRISSNLFYKPDVNF